LTGVNKKEGNPMYGKSRRKKTSRLKFAGKCILLGILIGLAIGTLNASAHYGDNTVAPYPYAVGDTFQRNGNDCITLYSWSDDGSAVAVCRVTEGEHKVISYDPNTQEWSKWQGCLRFDQHHRYIGGRKHNLERCYGDSLLSLTDN
jgi:hypothetical protein